jgi:hypothetical protein
MSCAEDGMTPSALAEGFGLDADDNKQQKLLQSTSFYEGKGKISWYSADRGQYLRLRLSGPWD